MAPPGAGAQQPAQQRRPAAPAAVDAYGYAINKLTTAQLSDQLACQALATDQLAAWKPYATSGSMPSGSKRKKMIRRGVPLEYRPWVWTEVSGAARLQKSKPPAYFRSLVETAVRTPTQRQIELDLPRTYPQHAWLASADGQLKLRNVLVAFAAHNVTIGYCQGLNCVAGFLLLNVNKDDEAAFWLLVALTETILYRDTYSAELTGCHVEMRTLDVLISTRLPKVHAHLKEVGCDVSIIATDWFLCLYCTSLPPEVTGRVWDALFNEGAKILFRVSLALLTMHQSVLLTYDNAGEVMQAIKDGNAGMYQRDRLMKVAFDDIGSLSMSKIEDIRSRQREFVLAMLKEREAVRRKQELKDRIEESRRQQEERAQRQLDEDVPDLTDAERMGMELRNGLAKELGNLKEGFGAVLSKVGGALQGAGKYVSEQGNQSNQGYQGNQSSSQGNGSGGILSGGVGNQGSGHQAYQGGVQGGPRYETAGTAGNALPVQGAIRPRARQRAGAADDDAAG